MNQVWRGKQKQDIISKIEADDLTAAIALLDTLNLQLTAYAIGQTGWTDTLDYLAHLREHLVLAQNDAAQKAYCIQRLREIIGTQYHPEML